VLQFRLSLSVLCFALAAGAPQLAAQGGEDPRAVVRSATRAVEGDSAARVRARLEARAARGASDRAALVGLATLDRLAYAYRAVERICRQRISGGRDRSAVYARLGLAEGFEARSMTRDAGPEF